MADAPGNKFKNHICVGLLAHVDAGKTTLAEGLLYTCGNIRSLGRVDHKDAFLDNFALERDRGITIFSKQAQIQWGNLEITLLDTPGHVDFSAEMERTLQVLDYAVLVISGADGVQGHVETLWRLLKRYGIPVFLFVNKMDQDGTDKEKLLSELQKRLDERCVEFGSVCGEGQPEADILDEEVLENIALCQESLMEEYLEMGSLSEESIADAVADRKLFPCYFGSALRLWGVEMFLRGLDRYCLVPEYPEDFGARVFKIARDEAGNRLTYLKVTGGVLRVKQMLSNAHSNSGTGAKQIWEQKADQLRVYNGSKYRAVDEVPAGGICAVTGLKATFAGQGLGMEIEDSVPLLEPVLVYRLILPEGSEPILVLGQLRQLEEEEPELHIAWKEELREIHVQVMGEVQTEVLKSMIAERFGLEVSFGEGSIVYKETIAAPVEGIGHFEPLRHYAEVHLLLEPGERGSGLQTATLCSGDMLDKSWQRLVMTHLEEKTHVGVLTGSEITDMRIVLVAGRAHEKHTEGGDFRQASYRAVRQGLRRSRSVLLEPVFAFTLEVPTEYVGRAMSDIQRMYGSFDTPVPEGENMVLTGSAPVATMRDYQREVTAYTRGRGRLSCALKGYEPCHNAEEVIASMQYDPEADTANPTGSVFCAHGAGFLVPWDQVEQYAHVQSRVCLDGEAGEGTGKDGGHEKNMEYGMEYGIMVSDVHSGRNARRDRRVPDYITQEEIEEIFSRNYSNRKKDDHSRFRRYHRKRADGGGRANDGADSRRAGSETDNGKRTNNGTDSRRAGSEAGSSRDNSGTNCNSGTGNEQYSRNARRGAAGKVQAKKGDYLLVDGYNIIFAWDELRELSRINIDSARDKLMDIMCNYQGYMGNTLILVFDAYKVKGNPGTVFQYHNIHVVYTKEAETADQYIEKAVHDIGRNYNVTVATSDRLEQMIIWGSGAMRMSARELKEAVDALHPQGFCGRI